MMLVVVKKRLVVKSLAMLNGIVDRAVSSIYDDL